ncbi:hypothetical protein VNI00_010072 [Paramarasmius palmivorus]|uniref:Uncharacterized protein n=1 Tax=Paramarasmius palmivorus TaxID=297713 RepID=A0AAW0CHA6_9AGAR
MPTYVKGIALDWEKCAKVLGVDESSGLVDRLIGKILDAIDRSRFPDCTACRPNGDPFTVISFGYDAFSEDRKEIEGIPTPSYFTKNQDQWDLVASAPELLELSFKAALDSTHSTEFRQPPKPQAQSKRPSSASTAKQISSRRSDGGTTQAQAQAQNAVSRSAVRTGASGVGAARQVASDATAMTASKARPTKVTGAQPAGVLKPRWK